VACLPVHLDALVDFTPPAGAFTVSADVLPGATNTGRCAIGFTSNIAQLTNNFFTFGQVWRVLHGDSTFTTRTWEVHVNGTNGASVSGTVVFTSQWFPLMLSYDPATRTVQDSARATAESPETTWIREIPYGVNTPLRPPRVLLKVRSRLVNVE
jgi:hypothetical protein